MSQDNYFCHSCSQEINSSFPETADMAYFLIPRYMMARQHHALLLIMSHYVAHKEQLGQYDLNAWAWKSGVSHDETGQINLLQFTTIKLHSSASKHIYDDDYSAIVKPPLRYTRQYHTAEISHA